MDTNLDKKCSDIIKVTNTEQKNIENVDIKLNINGVLDHNDKKPNSNIGENRSFNLQIKDKKMEDDSIMNSISKYEKNNLENNTSMSISNNDQKNKTRDNSAIDKNITQENAEISKIKNLNKKNKISEEEKKTQDKNFQQENISKSSSDDMRVEEAYCCNKKLEYVQKNASKILNEPVIKFIIRFISYCLKNIDSRTINEFVLEIKEVANTTATKQDVTIANELNTGRSQESLNKKNSQKNLNQNSNFITQSEDVESISHNSQQF